MGRGEGFVQDEMKRTKVKFEREVRFLALFRSR
jgi:hypothetical protein